MSARTDLLYLLLETGNYVGIVQQILACLDIGSLQSLCSVDTLCSLRLGPFLHQRKKQYRLNWLHYINDKSKVLLDEKSAASTNPVIVCDEVDVCVICFDSRQGWNVHSWDATTLEFKFKQCLYNLDALRDFYYTQYIGNVQISKHFLVVTPTTPGHEVHLWRRLGPTGLSRAFVVIRQQLKDRFSAVLHNFKILLYRQTLFSVYDAETSSTKAQKCWTYRCKEDCAIKKVVGAQKSGILVWEQQLKNKVLKNWIDLRDFDNCHIKRRQMAGGQKINDMILAGWNDTRCHIVMDVMSPVDRVSGSLELYEFHSNQVLQRFNHEARPQHGWVHYCRSICPPKLLPALALVPFIQYNLVLDVENGQVTGKKANWPTNVEALSYNSRNIFYCRIISEHEFAIHYLA